MSGETLAVAVQQENQKFVHRSFENRASGDKELVGWLQKRKGPVQVSLEATGVYSLDLALALHEAEKIEVAVLNPTVFHRLPRRSEGQKPMLRTLRFSPSTPAECLSSCGQHPAGTASASAL